MTVKHIPPAIKIANDPQMRENILSGVKQITIREGMRNYKNGPATICCEKEPFVVDVDIVDVRKCPLYEVKPVEWEADGFTSQENMLEEMRTYYPSMTLGSWVTVVRWENVRGKLVDDYRS